MGAVIGERKRVGDADAGKGQPLLARHPVERLGWAKTQAMLAGRRQACVEQRGDVRRRHGAIGDPPLRRFDLDQRLQPEHAARAVADDLDGDPATLRLLHDGSRDTLGADRKRGGIDRNKDADWRAHASAPWRQRPATVSASTRP